MSLRAATAGCSLIFLVVAGPCLGRAAGAQEEFQVRSWHVENGLLDGTVTALAQTPEGFLWVGTPKGLDRFDGVSFTAVDFADSSRAADRFVTGLLVDRTGALWITSQSGLVTQLAGGQFRVRHAPSSPGPNRPPGPGTEDSAPRLGLSLFSGRLALDRQGAVWAMLEDGTVLRFQGPGAASVPGATRLPSGPAAWLLGDVDGGIWVAKGTQEWVYTDGDWLAVPEAGVAGATWEVACPARDKGIWVALLRGSALAGSQVRRRSPLAWTGAPVATPPAPESARSQISAVAEDRRGRLWLGMYWSGVFVRDASGRWQRVQVQGPLAQGIVTRLFEDRDGAIWAGTIGEGLHQIIPKSVTMVMLPPDAGESIVNTAMAGRDGSVWLGTDGKGIFRWQPGHYTRYGVAEGLPHEHVCAILEDAQSNVWAGTWAGLARFDGTNFLTVTAVPRGQLIAALFSDRAGNLWAGGPGGLYEGRGTNWVRLQPEPTLPPLDIRCLAQDPAGNVWVAAIGAGLLRVQGQQLVRAGPEIGFRRTDVRSVLCAQDGALWIGTLNGGLFRYAKGQLKSYSMADGLPDDSIISLISDKRGNLWMSSNNGIFGCSRQRLALYVRGQTPALLCWRLSPASGLSNRGCSGSGQPVATASPDGRLWLADMRGVASFDPAVVTLGSSPPNVFVESVTGDGSVLASLEGRLRAPASTRRFEFHYTAPDLAAPATLRFRYRLEPLDREWVDAGLARSAAYSRLLPGTYHFRVMAGGADGQWHEAAEPLALVVVPRLWQATWFQATAAVLLFTGLALVVKLTERRKLQRRLERMEAQQALETERRRIARDLHDDLGAGLAEVVLLGELWRNGNVPAGELHQHLNSMTDKMRSLVTAMDEVVWTVNPRNDSVKSLAAYLSDHMQRFLGPAGIRCRVSIPDDLPDTPLSAQFRHNLFLAFKEALHNVIKHSGAKEVRLQVQCSEAGLALAVEDDGQGFQPAAGGGERNGLENMRSRLESLGGSLNLETAPGAGAKIVFHVPLVPKTNLK